MSRDGRRPDGVTMIPWASGRCLGSLAWDTTVADTLAPSHLPSTAALAGAAAEHAARSKHAKYAAISATRTFVPLAFETLGPICDEGRGRWADASQISRGTPEKRNSFSKGYLSPS